MTSRDWSSIKNLYYIHRFTIPNIARLYGTSDQAIRQKLDNKTFSLSDTNCLLCGLEEIINPFYIDGNEDNESPQNVLMLCEADKRRIIHLQLRRRVKSQS